MPLALALALAHESTTNVDSIAWIVNFSFFGRVLDRIVRLDH